jgi:hypothetical protein
MSFPEVWKSSTSEGTLTVLDVGNQLEVSETITDAVGITKSNYLFGYSFNDKLKFAGNVRSFSGGSVYTLRNLKEVKTVEYIPFVGENVKVKLDCTTILLPGVETTK